MFEKPVITSGLGNNTAQTHKQQDGERRRERRSEGEGNRRAQENKSRETEERMKHRHVKKTRFYYAVYLMSSCGEAQT